MLGSPLRFWLYSITFLKKALATALIILTVSLPLGSVHAQSAGGSSSGGGSGGSASSASATGSGSDVSQSSASASVAAPSDAGTGTTTGANQAPSDSSVVGPVNPVASDDAQLDQADADKTPSPEDPTKDPTKDPAKEPAPETPAPPKPADPLTMSSQESVGPFAPQVIYGTFNSDLIKIDNNTGAFVMTYPITIPPGRNGLQPDVSLTYDSQDTALNSIFGKGWSIKIPYIERLNKRGVDQLYSTSTPNFFLSSLDGELATSSATSTYVARTDQGTFDSYSFTNNKWTMTDKNGTQFIFGSSTTSQQNDPNNTGNVYRWMLEQVKDTNNNAVSYSYFKDNGQIYPSSTVYTQNGTSTGIFSVDFSRESRQDTASSSYSGFWVSSQYRVNEIDVKTNGSLTHKYALVYTTGANASTTLLSSVTETGWNASGTAVTLPAVTFSYKLQQPGWTSSSTWNPPNPFLDSSNVDNGVRVADALGNNLYDLLQGKGAPSGSILSAYLDNGGTGWATSSTWNPPINFYSSGDTGVRIMDVNGDGGPDLIQGYAAPATTTLAAYVNNGAGWTVSSTWTPPVAFLYSTGLDNGMRMADLNGKGLPDIVRSDAGDIGAWINNGSGWNANNTSTWQLPVNFVNSGISNGVVLVDVNGDGLPDILVGKSSTRLTYLNNGHGWTLDSSVSPPVALVDDSGNDNGTRIMDVNADGLPDFLVRNSGGSAAYINTGHGWAASSTWNSPALFVDSGANDEGVRIADANGDGLDDMLIGKAVGPVYDALINNGRFRADMLTGITYSQGGSSAIDYESATQYIGGGTTLNKGPYPVYVVRQITNNDGTQDVASTTYAYEGGTYYYGGPFDTRFAGFNKVTATDSAGNVTKTYYHNAVGTDASHGEYNDNYWKIGKPYRVEQYDNSSNLYKKTIDKWDSYALGGTAAFVKLASSTIEDYDGLGSHRDSAESYSYNNANGNVTEKIQWGEVVGADDGTFSDATSSDKFTTDMSYATGTTGVVGKPYDVTVTDQGSTKVKETRYYYDSLALGSVGAGNLTKQEGWKSSSVYVNSQNTYNSYGLITQHLDERSKATNYTYDTNNLYPATSTDALAHATGYRYDYSTGKTISTTDPNADTFQTSYDGLGRPLVTLQPDPNVPSALATSTAYTYTDTANAVSVKQSTYLATSTTVDSYAYYDGLNRVIQTRVSAEDSPNYKVTDRTYNNINLVMKESLPYITTGTSKTTATSTTALFTNYTYDALRRVLTTQNAVATTTYAYANWKTTITDPRGKPKDAYDDAYQNLTRVDEHSGTSTYSTYYVYDGLKDLTKITDALGNVRDFTYDGLARRLTAEDLHPSTSTTYGTWTYAYDDAGNMTQSLDPKSQTVNYTYDDVNRPLTEDYTGQAGTEATYTYDTCTQGKMRLCIASSTDAITSSTYNALGQLTTEVRTIATSTYTTSYSYDRQGNELTLTNPDNSKVIYTYNLAGLTETVSYQRSGGSSSSVINSFTYSPTDQPSIISYANGVTTTNTYDPTKTYRLTQKVSALPAGGNAQNLSYAYDTDGNITQIVDMGTSGAGRTVNYTYDDLSRLLTAATANVSSSPSYSQTFTYNALGNVLSSPVGTYSYNGTGYPNPDAVTAVVTSTTSGGGTISFDASSTSARLTGLTTTSTITVGAGTNQALAICLSVDQAVTSTMTVDGTPAKLIGHQTQPQKTADLYYFLNASSGTRNITATISISTNKIIGAVSLFGVDQTAPIQTSSTKIGMTALASSSLTTTTAGDWIVDCLGSAPTSSPLTGQITLSNNTSKNPHSGMSYKQVPTAQATSTGWQAGETGPWAYVNAAFKPASSSTATSTQSFAYDNDGNLTSSGVATTTWNYRNQLTQWTGPAGVTSTYSYDTQGQRVKLVESGVVTIFPDKAYNLMLGGNATTTKSIFVKDLLLATVTDVSTSTPTSTISSVLPDHLGGVNVVTNASGTVVETLDYYPYGSIRLDTKTGTTNEKRKFIGQENDAASGLDYLNARYYEGSRGQFLSEDPVFWELKQNIQDPQSLNSYSYANGNPITKSDPSGRCASPFSFVFCLIEAHDFGKSLNDIVSAYQMNKTPEAFSPEQLNHANNQAKMDVLFFLSGSNIAKDAQRGLDVLTTAGDALDKYTDAFKNGKKDNDDSKSNQIQLNIGSKGNQNSNSYSSQPGMNNGTYQNPNKGSNSTNMFYNQNQGPSQQIGNLQDYQKLLNLYSQLIGSYNKLINQSPSASPSTSVKK